MTQNYVHGSPGEPTTISHEQPFEVQNAELIASPVALPCGRIVSNRLVKVAMYEHLAAFSGGLPNQYHISLYSRWARGGWGMIITGNCQVSSSHLSLGRDIIIPSSISALDLESFRALSLAIHSSGTSPSRDTAGPLAIMQLSHSGRQSPRFIGGRLGTFRQPFSPSSRRVGDDTKEAFLSKLSYRLMFQTPRVLSREDIGDVVEEFVNAAKLACETGFDGVQLHAAHGYLLSQFLSSKLNTRKDEYSNAILLIQQIVTGIRGVTPAHFILGIKLNAGDYVLGGISEEGALGHVKQIGLLGVDFIEISGGDYENPTFAASTSPRQAFFSSFSRQVVQSLQTSGNKAAPLIVLTGGLRTPSQFSHVIRQNHANLLGIGRLSILCPDLPRQISPFSVPRGYDDTKFPLREPTLFNPRWLPKLIGAGVNTAWYTVGMRQLTYGKEVDIEMGTLSALFWMWAWTGPSGLIGASKCILFVLLLLPISSRLVEFIR
ncbi:hypothetical protein JB92DRAFT_2892414 [Gautieria morchelliformis]|nr:hypothetical protein JB92DRAFT_2892414 [Gautieria morchelliformis]